MAALAGTCVRWGGMVATGANTERAEQIVSKSGYSVAIYIYIDMYILIRIFYVKLALAEQHTGITNRLFLRREL